MKIISSISIVNYSINKIENPNSGWTRKHCSWSRDGSKCVYDFMKEPHFDHPNIQQQYQILKLQKTLPVNGWARKRLDEHLKFVAFIHSFGSLLTFGILLQTLAVHSLDKHHFRIVLVSSANQPTWYSCNENSLGTLTLTVHSTFILCTFLIYGLDPSGC